jgi:nucleotide-binding universal stress UspA family protein
MKRRFKILVPLDGSEGSLKAAEYATHMAKLTGASVTFMHVIATPLYLLGYRSPSIVATYYGEVTERTQKWLDKVTNQAKKEGVRAESDIVTGAKSVVESIVDYADKNDVDLIVISSGGIGRFKFLVGSIANGVVSRAYCPVLLVK